MLLYVAGVMDPAEQEMLRAHLAGGCPRCAGALAEAEATVAHLPMTLKPVEPPKSARDKLMQRVLASPGRAVSSPSQSRSSVFPWAVAAAAVLALTVGGIYLNRTATRARDAIASRQQVERELLTIRDENTQLRNVAALLNSSQLDLVKLASQESPARGRIFWDRERNRWHVQVFDLAAPKPGREFELWFITPDDRKIPAGTFRVDASGRGVHEVEVPKDIGPIKLAAITDEPIGGAPQPTGSIHLAGSVQ